MLERQSKCDIDRYARECERDRYARECEWDRYAKVWENVRVILIHIYI